MKPKLKLAEATTPEGQTMELHQHDGDFFISVNGQQLMTSFSHGSEEELGRMAVQPFRGARQPVVLVGGLGLGYTLKAVLESLPQSKAQVVVSEILPEIVDWNKEHMDVLHPNLLNDGRVSVKIQPVQQLIKEANETYHSILLDVDNGPSAFSGKENNELYSSQGLARLHSALKSGGLLSIWSAYSDPQFTKRLRKAGFDTSVVEVPAAHKGRKRRMHTIWLAKKGQYISQHTKA